MQKETILYWYLNKTWYNIWWWRILTIGAWIITILILITFFDMMEDYRTMYHLLEELGYFEG